jgi:hypothetical protein
MKLAYSLVVDEHPRFAYCAWHLSHSLQHYCDADAQDIHIHFTEAVPPEIVQIFAESGYRIHRLQAFGDGKWCNKLSQLPNMLGTGVDAFVLLDTDTIAVADIRPFISGSRLSAKPVDCANPPLEVLHRIFTDAGLEPPPACRTDTDDGDTLPCNANGGFYAIPESCAAAFSDAWRKWALWLLENPSHLQCADKLMHVDQVAAALAVADTGIPFEPAPSNVNYFTHLDAPHNRLLADKPIALLHYHDASLNVLGKLEPRVPQTAEAAAAIERANGLISRNFHNTLFWQFRYASFPERGSGVGSRGDNAEYKRTLLREQGLESARSILDVGCGDLEVLKDFVLKGYLGLDLSAQALAAAKAKRPDLSFELLRPDFLRPREYVLCLEVLIHQSTERDYLSLIGTLAEITEKTLIVSGYDEKAPHHMCFFYEPLAQSLAATKAFSKISKVGSHSDVNVYRCEKQSRDSMTTGIFRRFARKISLADFSSRRPL